MPRRLVARCEAVGAGVDLLASGIHQYGNLQTADASLERARRAERDRGQCVHPDHRTALGECETVQRGDCDAHACEHAGADRGGEQVDLGKRGLPIGKHRVNQFKQRFAGRAREICDTLPELGGAPRRINWRMFWLRRGIGWRTVTQETCRNMRGRGFESEDLHARSVPQASANCQSWVYSGRMFRPVSTFIGLRYTRARRRNQFISFISLSSIVGVALGVAALIVVLSVMNGFQTEIRERMLGMTSHATVVDPINPFAAWPDAVATLERQSVVEGAAPFIRAQAMLTERGAVTGAIVRGVLPEYEPSVSVVGERMVDGTLESLTTGGFNIILGAELARTLGVAVGDDVTVVAPQPTTTAVGIVPRLKRFNVTGIFSVGMHEYDSALALINLEDARVLFRVGDGVTGVRLKFANVLDAPMLARALARNLEAIGLPGYYEVYDWTENHRNFFRALKTEKTVMFVILTLIVAVAAFNIVSTLVMVVTDKQSDIAVLMTMGMTPAGVMRIFLVLGVSIGLFGILLGVGGGVLLALNVETLVPAIERAFKVQFLPADVYYISDFPSELHLDDVLVVALTAFVLAVLATLYPAWKAAHTEPAEALRYE